MRPNRLLAAIALAAVASSTLVGCVVAPLGPAPYYAGYGSYPGYAADVVPMAPPPPRVEVVGVAPADGQVWVGGYWNWTGARHVWNGGHWAAPPPGHRWVPHEWQRSGPGWRQRPGYWSRGR
jgi:hypothetical protein